MFCLLQIKLFTIIENTVGTQTSVSHVREETVLHLHIGQVYGKTYCCSCACMKAFFLSCSFNFICIFTFYISPVVFECKLVFTPEFEELCVFFAVEVKSQQPRLCAKVKVYTPEKS